MQHIEALRADPPFLVEVERAMHDSGSAEMIRHVHRRYPDQRCPHCQSFAAAMRRINERLADLDPTSLVRAMESSDA